MGDERFIRVNDYDKRTLEKLWERWKKKKILPPLHCEGSSRGITTVFCVTNSQVFQIFYTFTVFHTHIKSTLHISV